MKKKKRSKKIRRSTTHSRGHNQVCKTLRKLGYGVKNEFMINDLSFDMFIKDLNLVIEYNGDRWHYNKNIYPMDFYDKVKKRYAWEKWEKDKKKIEFVIENGYNIEIIWEYDWKRLSNRTRFLEKIVSKYKNG